MRTHSEVSSTAKLSSRSDSGSPVAPPPPPGSPPTSASARSNAVGMVMAISVFPVGCTKSVTALSSWCTPVPLSDCHCLQTGFDGRPRRQKTTH